jgi:hypothetical protein
LLLHPLLLLLLALFLFPVAVYCAILGMINRRPQPLVVSGAWDFLGVLLATSGFLLFVGPAMLSGAFHQSLHDLPLHRESGGLASAVEEIWAAWWVLWVLYYLFVVGGAAFLMWTRRNTTVIYNVEPQPLEAALGRAAQNLGMTMERRGNRAYVGNGARDDGQLAADRATLPSSPTGQVLIIDVEPFPLLSNVSLHWHSVAPGPRADLERELRKALAEVFTLENAAGSWLLGIAAFLFLFIMVLTGIFVALLMMLARAY